MLKHLKLLFGLISELLHQKILLSHTLDIVLQALDGFQVLFNEILFLCDD